MFPVPTTLIVRALLLGLLLTSSWALAQEAGAFETSTLDLAEAQARAQAYSPLLAAVSLGQEAASARRDQAGRWENPNLGLELEDFSGKDEYSGFNAAVWTLAISQVFDLSGKRSTTKDMFTEEISLLDWDRQSALLDLQQEVGLAFGEVWFAQEAVALVQEQKELAVQLQAELAARFEAGGGSPIEVTRARVGVSSAAVAMVQAEERLRTARHFLASLWGAEESDFSRVTLNPSFWEQEVITPDTSSIAANPDIARWDGVHSLQNAHLKVAKAATGVDLEVALGMKLEQESGTTALVLAAGIPLPVSDRNQDEVRAIGYDLERVSMLKKDSVNSILAQLAIAVENQNSTRRELEIMAAEIIPLARQAYEETRSAHQRGLFSLTDVLETRRNLFGLLRVELETQLRFYDATVKVARLTGGLVLNADPAALEVQ